MALEPHELARSAKELLDSKAFQQAMTEIEERYLADWRSTNLGDTTKREGLFAAFKALDDIRAKLHSYANAVKVQAHNNNLRQKHK